MRFTAELLVVSQAREDGVRSVAVSEVSELSEWEGSVNGDHIDDYTNREHRYGKHLFHSTQNSCTSKNPNVVVAY